MAKKKKSFEGLSLREQIKPIFKERFLEMLGNQKEYDKFVDCILTHQRKSFRINSLKEKEPQNLIENLKKKGVHTTPVPWCNNAYFLDYDPENQEHRSDLGNLEEHFFGKIYVQEATSMTPPELLEIPELTKMPESESQEFKILDMAAAPGSKTTQVGEKMNNLGHLVANEIDFRRLGPLKINLERSGLHNILIINHDGRDILGEELFDRIVLDAPCSGSGVIRKSPGTLKTYNPRKLKQMQNLQLKLMKRAFELLKKGGIMTYSTCSLDPEENELCVQKFLEEVPEAKLEMAQLPGLILNNKLTQFKGKEILKEITQKTMRIWPQDNNTNGFYVAKIKK